MLVCSNTLLQGKLLTLVEQPKTAGLVQIRPEQYLAKCNAISQVCESVQAAGKLSVTVLAWHTQAASNFQNAKFVWEQFSLPAAFKPETQQDPAHSDSAHTEATHTEAFHKKPVHVCPAEGPFKTDGSSTDVAPLLLQNNPEADGKSEATAAVPQKQRGRPKRSRNKHSTVSNAGTGASAGTTTGATGLAFRAASHTGCKQPPNRPVRPLP